MDDRKVTGEGWSLSEAWCVDYHGCVMLSDVCVSCLLLGLDACAIAAIIVGIQNGMLSLQDGPLTTLQVTYQLH